MRLNYAKLNWKIDILYLKRELVQCPALTQQCLNACQKRTPAIGKYIKIYNCSSIEAKLQVRQGKMLYGCVDYIPVIFMENMLQPIEWPIVKNLEKNNGNRFDCPADKYCTKNCLKPLEKGWLHKVV